MSETEDVTLAPKPEKTMTVVHATSLVAGTMVGTGIFITVKEAFAMFNDQPIMLVAIAWFIAGLVSLIGALAYAELACRIPVSGGELVYFRLHLSPVLARTFAIFVFCGIRPLSMSVILLTLGKYTVAIVDPNYHVYWLPRLVAFGALLIITGINMFSKKLVNTIGVVLSNSKLIALFLIFVLGIHSLSTKSLPEWKAPFKTSGLVYPASRDAIKDLAWTYEGWNTPGVVAGELKNPVRDIPIALMIGVVLVSFSYSFCVISYSAIMGYDTAKTTEELGSQVASIYLGKFRFTLPLLIALSAFGSANYDFFANGIIGMSAGHAGELPGILSLVRRNSRIPVISILATFLMVIFMLPLSLNNLTGYVGVLAWICYFFSFIVLIKLKRQSRTQAKLNIFQIPLPFVIFMQIVCVCVVVLCLMSELIGSFVVIGVAILIILLHCIPRRFITFPALINAHSNLCKYLENKFDLTPATQQDLSS